MKQTKYLGIDLEKNNSPETAIYGLACTYSLIEKKISDCLRPFNLSPAKFNAMMVLKHKGRDSGLSQVEIGRSLIVSASNMTRLLDRLYKEGFIERFSREGDRRVNLIRITKKGSQLLDKAWPGYYKKIKGIANNLDVQELKQFSNLIIKWCRILENS